MHNSEDLPAGINPETQNTETRESELVELSFAQLQEHYQEVASLASTSFQETGNGFKNIEGNGISIGLRGNIYKITGMSDEFNKKYARFIIGNPTLTSGSTDPAEMLDEIRSILLEQGNRIIE